MNNWDSLRLEQIEENTRKIYKALDRFALAMERIADALDRKTENCSEKPNNCDTCKHNKLEWYSEVCDGCSKAHSNYEPKDEPQTEKHKCRRCLYYDISSDYYPCSECVDYSNYSGEVEDEPQTERSE